MKNFDDEDGSSSRVDLNAVVIKTNGHSNGPGPSQCIKDAMKVELVVPDTADMPENCRY